MLDIRLFRCFLSCIYIKPQPISASAIITDCCFLSCIYIKPQHNVVLFVFKNVVSYLVSTSNHNRYGHVIVLLSVVSYLVSTSNHNNHYQQETTVMVVSYLVSTSNHNKLLDG